jgi:hypothetical protein
MNNRNILNECVKIQKHSPTVGGTIDLVNAILFPIAQNVPHTDEPFTIDRIKVFEESVSKHMSVVGEQHSTALKFASRIKDM